MSNWEKLENALAAARDELCPESFLLLLKVVYMMLNTFDISKAASKQPKQPTPVARRGDNAGKAK